MRVCMRIYTSLVVGHLQSSVFSQIPPSAEELSFSLEADEAGKERDLHIAGSIGPVSHPAQVGERAPLNLSIQTLLTYLHSTLE